MIAGETAANEHDEPVHGVRRRCRRRRASRCGARAPPLSVRARPLPASLASASSGDVLAGQCGSSASTTQADRSTRARPRRAQPNGEARRPPCRRCRRERRRPEGSRRRPRGRAARAARRAERLDERGSRSRAPTSAGDLRLDERADADAERAPENDGDERPAPRPPATSPSSSSDDVADARARAPRSRSDVRERHDGQRLRRRRDPDELLRDEHAPAPRRRRGASA